MSSYLVSRQDVKNYSDTPVLYRQQGVSFAYSAPAEVLQRLIPPPLKLADSVIIGNLVEFSNTTFGSKYIEFLIGSPCTYQGVTGIYSYSLLLQGSGAETGLHAGIDCCGFPKKFAGSSEINRIGSKVTAKVARHGTVLFDCEVDLTGSFNDSTAETYLGNPQPGEISNGVYYNHKFDVIQTENGNTKFSNVRLVKLETESKSISFKPGEIKSLKLNSSPDDPLAELAVAEFLGATYRQDEYVEMSRTFVLEKLDTLKTMPYLMTGRYDRSLMGDHSNYMYQSSHSSPIWW